MAASPGAGVSAGQIETQGGALGERIPHANGRRKALRAITLMGIHRVDTVHAVQQRDAEPCRRKAI
jgi:hypothetical protein